MAQPMVFLLCSALLIAAAYLVFRIVLRRDYARHQRLSWYSTLLEFLIFLLHANLSYLFVPAVWPGLPILGTNNALNTIGFLLIAVGLAVVITSMTRLSFTITLGSTATSLRQSGLVQRLTQPADRRLRAGGAWLCPALAFLACARLGALVCSHRPAHGHYRGRIPA